jgi:hypothetical protein
MTRTLLAAAIAALVPAVSGAQEAKSAPLADYVSFCLAVWEGARDLPSRAAALGVFDAAGSTGAIITIGKTALRVYKSPQSIHMVGVTTTTFEDGKDWSCEVNFPRPVERAELETMEQAADLDGQIVTLSGTSIGRWKMRQPRTPVMVKMVAGKLGMLTVHKYEPMPAGANAKLTR